MRLASTEELIDRIKKIESTIEKLNQERIVLYNLLLNKKKVIKL
jgi:translation initiation factor 2B subunit (eIF-2B alpha/beta/delta family)